MLTTQWSSKDNDEDDGNDDDGDNLHLYSLECKLTVLALRSASILTISGVVSVIFLPFTSNDNDMIAWNHDDWY